MDKQRLLTVLNNEFQSAEKLAHNLGLPASTVASFSAQLEAEKLVETKKTKKKFAELTPEGRDALSGLPERRLVSALKTREEAGSLLSRTHLSPVSLQWAKKNNWVVLEKKDGKTFVKKLSQDKSRHEELLEKLGKNRELIEEDLQVACELEKRTLVRITEHTDLFVRITSGGAAVFRRGNVEEISQVTPQIVKYGTDKKLRGYDVEADVAPIFPGKKHPLQVLADEMKGILIGMGFEEMDGPLVESSFWNFDTMFMPQNHPNRDLMDTFFLKQPSKAKVPQKLADIVKQVHLTGWKTGSKGCAEAWSIEEAQRTILRTHTTATTFRYLEKIGKKEIKTPCRFFSINKVFRNEAIDRTHLPEFHQIEGFVVADNLTLRHLMGVFSDFYKQLGISSIRFKPVFNPYTEPSMEIFGYHEALAKWIEIGNSGIFRPETTLPLGLNQNIIAWGLALERAAMILFEVDDIRKVVGASTDLQWIRDFPQLPGVLR
ncbi:phenylalanine--tRNA ligase subunit alpha [Candidatus Micrarchaeota archaeon]|nr:phenylalanine--tRNA ligase subunit alpha [Candidatus Micrarchaeota archaeon]